jgi:hypothetical protein
MMLMQLDNHVILCDMVKHEGGDEQFALEAGWDCIRLSGDSRSKRGFSGMRLADYLSKISFQTKLQRKRGEQVIRQIPPR